MDEQNEVQNEVWPPPVCANGPPVMPVGKREWGWASAWAGGIGLSFWLCAAVVLGLLPDATTNKVLKSLNAVLSAGPPLALAGVVLGGLGRWTRRGRFGLVFSLLVLTARGSLIAYIRHATGYWLWLRPVKVYGSCGCG